MSDLYQPGRLIVREQHRSSITEVFKSLGVAHRDESPGHCHHANAGVRDLEITSAAIAAKARTHDAVGAKCESGDGPPMTSDAIVIEVRSG